ncbi:MAG: Restriction endonuclease, type EcoRI, subunit/Type [Firmicutes bacterium]|nr:Restriction endonuclease, type EcoRI, subunit/Type [Bacillota bacterium]
MNFEEKVQTLSAQILERKSHITNEEMTKHSLIIPFIQLLGFDIFNPLEVQPEYTADFGKKRGEKVDYAVLKDNKIIMFIEAKPVGSRLDNHTAQLSRYFNSTPELKLAIITDGVKYNFFSDVKQANIMDTTPFFEFNFSSITNSDIETLSQFRKSSIENSVISKLAEDLSSVISIQEVLRNLFDEPSDEFIRFIIKQTGKTRLTNGAIDRYRPLIKESLLSTLSEIFNEVSKEVLQPSVVKSQRISPKITRCAQTLIETPLDKDSEPAGTDHIRLEMTDMEQRIFSRVQKLLQAAEFNTTEFSFHLLTDEIIFLFNNQEFLIFNSDDKCHFRSPLDANTTKEMCPYYEVLEEHGKSIVTFNSPADIGNLKKFILASLDICLKN